MTDEFNPQGFQHSVQADVGVTTEATPEPPETVEAQSTDVIFVPFEDFTGRINQVDFNFRKDVPTKIPKAESNIWLEGKRGYIK